MENLENIENQRKSTGSKRSFDVAFLAESDDTREKSAFTKYNNKKSVSDTLNTNVTKEDNSINTTTTNVSVANTVPPNINMMQFPALRKLLDITGNTSPWNGR